MTPATHTDNSGKTRRIARITIVLGALAAVAVVAWTTLTFAGPARQSGQAHLRAGQKQSQADGSGTGREPRQRIAQRMAAELGLTPEQRQEVRATLQAHRGEIRDLADKIQQTRQTLRQAAEAQPPDENAIRAAASQMGWLLADAAKLRASVGGEVKSKLTPEQVSQWQQWRDSHRPALRQRLFGGVAASDKAN